MDKIRIMRCNQINYTIRLAQLEDAPIMSKIHGLRCKEPYKGLIPQEYLDGGSEDKWIKPFTRALSKNIHEAAKS